ncbi:MAG: hypothetical protein QMB54_06770 [Neofamilia sp.]
MAEAAKKLDYSKIYPANLDVQKNNKTQNKKLVRRRKIFLTLLYTSFLLISTIFMLSNYAKITSLNFEIRRIDAIITEAEKTELNLHAKVEEIKSKRDIVDEAKTKLGMVFPENNQVVYFTLRDTERVEEDKGIISSIFSTLIGNRE